MKARLTVTQGKLKGKTFDLSEPIFMIGRGETCHLRPTSELVSREHAEFAIKGESLIVRDMGSRNGTLVNGKALTAPATLKHGDLVQVGPLTFSVAVEGGPATEPEAGAPTVAGSGLMPDPDAPARDLPGGVHGGSTMMIPAFKNTPAPPRAKAKAKTKTPPAPVKPADKGETDAASDILSKMMTRRREPKS